MIQLFVVFHKHIFDECYKYIPPDILQNYFTFFAVNESIPKEYTPNKYKIVNEWELPIYDKSFQEKGYRENSALYHVYANKLHAPYTHVGFFQYDMIFNDNIVDFIQTRLTGRPIYFPFELRDFLFCSDGTWNEPRTSEFVIRDYEAYFHTTFRKDTPLPLYNSYVISIEIYEKVMGWIVQLYDKLYPWCIQPPNQTHHGHIAGIYERIMAYAIGQEPLLAAMVNISHREELKEKCY